MQNKYTNKSLKDIACEVFTYVYPPVGYDPVYSKLNGVPIDKVEHSRTYLRQIKTNVAGFLGLNNRRPAHLMKINLKTLFWNFIGWEEDFGLKLSKSLQTKKSRSQRLKIFLGDFLQVCLSLYFWPIFNLVTGLIALTYNIIKFFTEFIPRFLAKLCNKAAHILDEKEKAYVKNTPAHEINHIYHLGLVSLYLLAKLAETFCHAWHFVGRAYSTPALGIRAGWKLGKSITTNKTVGTILGFLFAGLSATLTLTIFLFTMPLTAKLYAPIIAKFAVGQASFIGKFLESLKPVFAALGHTVMPIFKFMLFKPYEIGRAIVTSILLIFSSSMIYLGKTKTGNYLHRNRVKHYLSYLDNKCAADKKEKVTQNLLESKSMTSRLFNALDLPVSAHKRLSTQLDLSVQTKQALTPQRGSIIITNDVKKKLIRFSTQPALSMQPTSLLANLGKSSDTPRPLNADQYSDVKTPLLDDDENETTSQPKPPRRGRSCTF